jgi:hypothetical protein
MYRTPRQDKPLTIPEYNPHAIKLSDDKYLVSNRVKNILEKADKEILSIYEQHIFEKQLELEKIFEEEEKRVAHLKYFS